MFPKGPGDFTAVDAQTIRSLCEEIWNIETTAIPLSADLRDRCLELRQNIVPEPAIPAPSRNAGHDPKHYEASARSGILRALSRYTDDDP